MIHPPVLLYAISIILHCLIRNRQLCGLFHRMFFVCLTIFFLGFSSIFFYNQIRIVHVIRYFHILFFLLKTHYLSFTSWLTNKSIYNFISTDFLPLSTDSLVIPSNAPAGIGFPAFHVGSAAFAASANACLY